VKRLATLGEMQVLASMQETATGDTAAAAEEVERVFTAQRAAEDARDVEERAWQAVEAAGRKA
jgi:hypothetical protein